MGKLILLLFLTLAIVQLAFAEDIERPWNDYDWLHHNQYIAHPLALSLSDEDYWDWNLFGMVLDGLNINEVSRLGINDTGVTGSLKASAGSISTAKEKTALCRAEVKFAMVINSMGVSLVGYLSPEFDRFVSAIYQNNSLGFLTPSCNEYDIPWRAAMDNAMNALGQSMSYEQATRSKSEAGFTALQFTGLCDEDYSGEEKAKCNGIAGIVFARNAKTEEFNAELVSFNSHLEQQMPDAGKYNTYMNMLWEKDSGIISLDQKIETESAQTKLLGENNYKLIAWQADTSGSNAQKNVIDLQKQSLELITETATGGNTIGTVAERYAELSKINDNAISVKEEALKQGGVRKQGYLKNAILGMRGANGKFLVVSTESPKLLEDAKKVVAMARAQAENEISKFNEAAEAAQVSAGIESWIAEAKAKKKAGDGSAVPGIKYESYYQAARDARIALGLLSGNNDANLENEFKSWKNMIGGLLAKAEAAGIGVYDERSEYDGIVAENKVMLLENLKGIEKSIIAKVFSRYSFLQDKRDSIMKRMKLLPEMASTIKEMESYERDFVSDGRIDFALALTSKYGLGEIEKKYNYYEGTLENKEAQLVANSLQTQASYFTGGIVPGQESTVAVTAFIKNTQGYQAQNVKAEINLPIDIELAKSDIVQGAENIKAVSQSGSKKLTLEMKNIGTFENYFVKFEKQEAIAWITKDEVKSAGKGDGSASVTENVDFNLKFDTPISVSDYENVKVDKKAYRGETLRKGSHALESSHEIPDAYSVRTENYKVGNLGLNNKVDYDIIFTPNIDLDSITFLVSDKNFGSIKSFGVIAISGEKVANGNFLDSGLYSFQVFGLGKGSDARVRVSYVVENSRGYIEQKLQELGGIKTTEKIQIIINEAKNAFKANDTQGALEKITQAENELEKAGFDKAKNEKTYNKLAGDVKKKIDSLENAIALGNGMDDVFLAALATRKAHLEDNLASASGIAESSFEDALTELNTIDKTWEAKQGQQKRKDMLFEYNGIKEKFLKINPSLPMEFAEFEQKLKTADISAKIEDTVDALVSLQSVKSTSAQEEASAAEAFSRLQKKFTELKGGITKNLDKYSSESKTARGSKFEYFFTIDASDVEKEIKSLEALFNGKTGNDRIENGINGLESAGNRLEGILKCFKRRQSKRRIAQKAILQ